MITVVTEINRCTKGLRVASTDSLTNKLTIYNHDNIEVNVLIWSAIMAISARTAKVKRTWILSIKITGQMTLL